MCRVAHGLLKGALGGERIAGAAIAGQAAAFDGTLATKGIDLRGASTLLRWARLGAR